MTTPWAKVLGEINQGFSTHGPTAVDVIRRQKIAAVTAITGRPLVIYATACTTPGKPVPDALLMIEPSDKMGFQEVTAILKGLEFGELDHRFGFAQTFSYTLEFFKDQRGRVIVEPHWSIAYPPFVDRVEMDAVWKRCVWGRVVGVDTWLLGRADLLLHLCLHAIHQGKSAPLLWFYEIDRLLRHELTVLDWRQVVFIARETGLELFQIG